jgi:hypothetical protein
LSAGCKGASYPAGDVALCESSGDTAIVFAFEIKACRKIKSFRVASLYFIRLFMFAALAELAHR